MIRRRTAVWSGAGAVGVALLGWAFAPRPVAVETAAVQAGRFEQGIEEDGRTRVRDRYTVSAPVAARLTASCCAKATGSARATAWRCCCP